MTAPADDRHVARAVHRWRMGVSFMLAVFCVIGLAWWALWSWIASTEPRRIDLEPLEHIAERTTVVAAPSQSCPMGSPPAEPCSGNLLVAAGSTVDATSNRVRTIALNDGFRDRRITRGGPTILYEGRRGDVCLSAYDSPDPFQIYEPPTVTPTTVPIPAGASFVHLWYCGDVPAHG